MSYKFNNIGSVEGALFKHFAEILVYWHHGDVSIKEFREYLTKYVGGNITEKSISNWFTRNIDEISIDEWRVHEFCNAFRGKYESFSDEQKIIFSEINAAFKAWENAISNGNDIYTIPQKGTFCNDYRASWLKRELSKSVWYTYILAEENNTKIIERGVIRFGQNLLEENSLSFQMNPAFKAFPGMVTYTDNSCLSISFNERYLDYRNLHLEISHKFEKDKPVILVGIMTNITHKLEANFMVLEKKYKTENDAYEAGKFQIGDPQIPQGISELLCLNIVKQINFPTRAISYENHIDTFLKSYHEGETKFPSKYPTWRDPYTRY